MCIHLSPFIYTAVCLDALQYVSIYAAICLDANPGADAAESDAL